MKDKKKETENFKYIQREVMVGNKRRSVIIIDKKPDNKLTNGISSLMKAKVANASAATIIATKTITRKKCGGCSRKRRG